MNNFRPALFGVISNIDGEALIDCNSYFKSYIRSSQDHAYLTSPDAIKSIIGRIKMLTGRNFTEFMIINYENGIGKRAELVRNFSHFLEGKISTRGLISSVKMEELFCAGMIDTERSYETKIIANIQPENVNKVKSAFTEKGFYHILTAMGPVLFCRLMLTFSGEVYDGNN